MHFLKFVSQVKASKITLAKCFNFIFQNNGNFNGNNRNPYENRNPYDNRNSYDDRNSNNGRYPYDDREVPYNPRNQNENRNQYDDRNRYNDNRPNYPNDPNNPNSPNNPNYPNNPNDPNYPNDPRFNNEYDDRNRYTDRDYEQHRLELERENRIKDANLRRILGDVDKLASSECSLNVGAQWNFETNVNEVTQQESVRKSSVILTFNIKETKAKKNESHFQMKL